MSHWLVAKVRRLALEANQVIVHDRFVFLQMRKTACTFVADVLQRELSSDNLRKLPKHAGWDDIPSEAVGRPVLVYVRNPWDWYVSWYHFNLDRAEPIVFWNELSEDGTLDFAETVRNAVAVSTKRWGDDFYSAVFRHLVGAGFDSELLTVGRFESLVDDLSRFLAMIGIDLGDGAIARMRAEQPFNASRRGRYDEYYDDQLRDAVGAGCRMFVDRFGYSFEKDRR